MMLNDAMISLYSNETLRGFAQYGVALSAMKSSARYDAIFARRELDRRDMAVTAA
jgi:hypothetical protein